MAKIIKEGQAVKIHTVNSIYMTYKSAFTKLGFNNTVTNPSSTNLKSYKNKIFTVFSVGAGKFEGLIGITDHCGTEILIKNTGVVTMKKTFNKSNSL